MTIFPFIGRRASERTELLKAILAELRLTNQLLRQTAGKAETPPRAATRKNRGKHDRRRQEDYYLRKYDKD